MRAKDNPFCTECLNGLDFRFFGADTHSLLDELERRGMRGAIVGPHGSGKTTLMERLRNTLTKRGWNVRFCRMDDRSRSLPANFLIRRPGPGELLCIDGIDLLPAWDRVRLRRASRTAGGLLVTAHRGGSLPTLYRCGTSKTLLRDLIGELLSGQRSVISPDLDTLYDRYGGNLREVFLHLYDLWGRT